MKFKIGQTVWDTVDGRGEVKEIGKYDNNYPVYVWFSDMDCSHSYTEEGKMWKDDLNVRLFTNPIIIVEIKASETYPHVAIDEDGGIYQYDKEPPMGTNKWSLYEKPEAYAVEVVNWKDTLMSTLVPKNKTIKVPDHVSDDQLKLVEEILDSEVPAGAFSIGFGFIGNSE